MKFRHQYFDREPANLAIIEHRDRLGDWLPRLGNDPRDPLGADTEGTGLRWDTDRVGGLCLAAGNTAMYLCKDALGPGIEWLRDQVKARRRLVFHHAKHDLHHLRGTFGLKIRYPVDDTMIMSFLIDNRGAPTKKGIFGGHDLKELGVSYVDPSSRDSETALYEAVVAAGGSRAKKSKRKGRDWKGDILLASTEVVGHYGAMDAWYTLQLYHQFNERINHWIQPDEKYPPLRTLYETEQWLLLALVDMEQRGILVNTEFFEKWKIQLEKQLSKIYRNLERLAGKKINWGSAPQLRELLFNQLGLEAVRYTKGGKKSGPQPSTDELSLIGLNHPIGEELLRLRQAEKQYGTYAKGLLAAVRSDGRIHANFKQAGPRTGRLSCEDPNLQQVTRGTKEKPGPRRGFIADPGLVFRYADYMQVEMRFAAHYSQDRTLVHGFRFDPSFDPHAVTAKRMWGLSGEPTKEQRKWAKIINFLILFGGGVTKLTSQLITMLSRSEARSGIRSFGVRPSRNDSPHAILAQLLMARYFQEFPLVKTARNDATRRADGDGYSINAFGRRRYLDESESYKAFNSDIQGSAADQSKQAIATVYRELQHSSGEIALLLQIHDEMVYLSDGDPKIDRQVLEIMNDHTRFRVPILASVSGSDTNWQDKVDIEIDLS